MKRFEKGDWVLIKNRTVSLYAGMDRVGTTGVVTMVDTCLNQYEIDHSSGWYAEDDLTLAGSTQFKVGDRVECLPGFEQSDTGGNYGGSGYRSGKTFVIHSIEGENKDIAFPAIGNGVYFRALKLVEEEVNNQGEEKMTNEEIKKPEYIIIVKNTEVFKKGGVFKQYGSFYAPENDAFTVKPYGENYIRHQQVELLLEKKIAVEAVKFNPEFVTLEQNELLTKTLAGMTKKAVVKSTKKA